MIKIFCEMRDFFRAVFTSSVPAKSATDELIDETDYHKPFQDRISALRAQSTQLSPSIIEGKFA